MSNRILKTVMKELHDKKKPLPDDPKTVVRTEFSGGRHMCEVWFMTKGCVHDKDGGCTMCNYGKSLLVEDDVILSELKSCFATLPYERYDLLINPSGSFLDDKEVAPELRQGIYALMKNLHFETLTVECRADVVNPAVLEGFKNVFPTNELYVEIGVESLDPWLLRNSINKGLMVENIVNALRMLQAYSIKSIANIGMGLPFINERYNISTAWRSVVQALDMGFDQVIVFPYHIKPGTLLEVLRKQSFYACCSLWSLVELLNMLTDAERERVNISWYRNYYTDKSKIIESPTTCPLCNNSMLSLLDGYKMTPGRDSLKQILSIDCACRDIWKQKIKSVPDCIDLDAVSGIYTALVDMFHIDANTFHAEMETMGCHVNH